MGKRKTFSIEKIILILKENEAGVPVVQLARQHGVAAGTIHRWKSKYGGMDVSEAKRLKELEEENAKLKKLLADTMLDNMALKDVLSKKVVSVPAKRQAVEYLQQTWQYSQRKACRLICQERSTLRYKPSLEKLISDQKLANQLKTLAESHPRYGYLMLHAMLVNQGQHINRKRVYRLYRLLGLQVRTARRKKLKRPRIPMVVPTRPDERWSMDFVSDALINDYRFRVLNIVDDFTKECVGQLVAPSITGQAVVRFLSSLKRRPKTVVVDNGAEFTSKAMLRWGQETGVKLHFIQPGKPTQNALIESFNGEFRNSCLNQHWFASMTEAKVVIEQWRHHYNTERPHSSIDYLPPAEFAARCQVA
ncbi:IS3 family transposase [Sulfurivirga caldicuralii]|uniref:IS3 family transposase n=1 Tax=Sulfurivirga caldicuralii TaxID=364032 RepID=UPI00389B05CE